MALVGAVVVTGCGGGGGDGASASSSPAAVLQGEAADIHMVDAEYHAFSASYVDCFNKLDAGKLDSTTQFAGCVEDGLTSSNLENSLARLRIQAESVEHKAEGECRAAAHGLVAAIEDQEAVPRTLRPALEAADIGTLNHEFGVWDEATARVHKLGKALVRACA
jgi:hypothetical protein